MPGYTSNPKKPDALELFTDREGEQKILRQILQPVATGALGGKHLLTAFYGVGGVGKTTLCQLARKIAQDEFSGRVTCAGTSFDDARWKPDKQFTEVAGEVCRCFAAVGIPLPMTLALLALYAQHTGDTTGGGLDNNWALGLDALDKGVEMAGVPGLALLVKGAQWLHERSQRQALRQRLKELGLWPEEQHGRINVSDLDGKLATSLFHDVVEWLKEHPDKHLRLLLDGFERLQSQDRREDAQKRLQEFIGCFAGGHEPEVCGRFRVLLFGREKLRWDELYQDPGWNECWSQHLLGGLAEEDAMDFLRKMEAWFRSHGQEPLADALVRNETKILDASDEKVHGQRAFYPFYLNLAVELVERARQRGTDPELGRAPAELQDRFFRYLDKRELRVLKILALSEVFDEALYDWLARERLIDFTAHSFHTEVRQEHSYFQLVDGRPGDWRFHRLFEGALHAQWLAGEAQRREGTQIVRRLLEYYGGSLKEKAERDWMEADVESWRRGMEIIVKQGPELGLLPNDEWKTQLHQEPWSTEQFRCFTHRLGFTGRILKEQERIFGSEHPHTLATVNKLGTLLMEKGDYEEAEALHCRALAGREKTLGRDHADTLTSLNDLGLLMSTKGDYTKGEVFLHQALVSRENLLGPDHPDTLTSAHHLAATQLAKGDFDGAERWGRQVFERRARNLGDTHILTVRSAENLAVCLAEKGDLAGAERLFLQSLEKHEKQLGPEDPKTLKSVGNLGELYRRQGRLNDAESMFRRALAGSTECLGAGHPDTLGQSINLSQVLAEKGDFAGALEFFQNALKGNPARWSLEDAKVLGTALRLASFLRTEGSLGGAVSLLARYATQSPKCLVFVRYPLACYESLSGNVEKAKRLITEEVAAKPAAREQALKDDDLRAIHDFIQNLPRPEETRPVQPRHSGCNRKILGEVSLDNLRIQP